MAEAGAEVEEMRKELRATMSGGAEHKSYASANDYGNSALPPPSAFDADSADGDAYGAFEQQRQAEIMHEQDEAIDGVFKTVGNLRQQADDMGRELEEQVELLEDVNQLTDRVQGKIQNGIMKVGWVIKNTEGASIIMPLVVQKHGRQSWLTLAIETWSSCCIGVLVFVLILLLILVLIL